MCGNVISGRVDPSLSFFTEGGSFFTNSTTELLASATEEELQSTTRNRCNGEGYESVALIPLHSGNDIVGLLQLNDSRPNLFSPPMIRFFEKIGNSIGIAFSKMINENDSKKDEFKYHR
jgi:transcriptional regulator with GAF, ATPase, and Fis domain